MFDNSGRINRRNYIRSVGAASVAGLASLAGCSGDSSTDDTSGDGNEGGATTGTASQNTITLQANSPAAEGSVHGDAAAMVGDIVSSRTDGAIEVEAFRNSELGGHAKSIPDI